MIVIEGEQPLVEERTGESAIPSPLSPAWSSSFEEETSSPSSQHSRRHLSPSPGVHSPRESYLQVYSPPSYHAPTPPAKPDSSPSRHGSSSRLGYYTPEPLPSPFLSPHPIRTPQLPGPRTPPSFTPSHSPPIDVTALRVSSDTRNRSSSPPQTPFLQLSPLPASSDLQAAPELPDRLLALHTSSQAPIRSPGHVHAPLPVHGYHHALMPL